MSDPAPPPWPVRARPASGSQGHPETLPDVTERGSPALPLGVCMSGSLSLHVVVLGLIIWLASVPPGMSALEVFPAPGSPSQVSVPAPSRPAQGAPAAQPARVAPARVAAPAGAKQSPDLRPPASTP